MKQPLTRLSQCLIDNLRTWTKPCRQRLLADAATDLIRSKHDLMVENALLRQQLVVLERQVKRPKLSWRDQVLLVVLASQVVTWQQALLIVKPDTVLRWHRDLFRWVWRRQSQV